MSGRPVLQSSFEYHVWKMLDGEAYTKDGPMGLVREIRTRDETINSAVLVMLLEALNEHGVCDLETYKDVVSKSRSMDAMPSVKASEIMFEKENLEAAQELLDMSSSSQEIVKRSMMQARIDFKKGNIKGAANAAGRVYAFDPSVKGAYEILASVDPEGGWPQRCNIQNVMEGEMPSMDAGDGRIQELYRIYYDWFTGRRETATNNLVESGYYKEKDPEFMLASARMSKDEKDWHSAYMVYSELMQLDPPPFVYVEAAEVSIRAGDPERALDLLARSDSHIHRVQEDVVKARMQMNSQTDLMDSIRAMLDSEESGSDDYIDTLRFLIDRGMDEEAEDILDAYSRYSQDEPDTMTMRSIMLMRSGDYLSAHRAASKAVRLDESNIPARAQLARVLYLMDKTEAAEKECDSILNGNPDNLDALELKMDLYLSQNDYERSAEVCRKILSNDATNIPAMTALAVSVCHLGDEQQASDLFRSVLKLDGTKENIMDVISSMISCGMTREAESVCKAAEQQFPKESMIKRLRGNIEYARGDYVKATVSYANAAALKPHNPVLWYSKGMADEARGDLESAEDAYNRALLLEQNEPEYWIAKACIQERLKDKYGAVESLNRAIELAPNSIFPLIKKASILMSASRYSEALYYVRQAAVIEPGNTRIMDMEASLLLSVGDSEGAQRMIEYRTGVEPTAEAYLRLARLRLSNGDKEGALIDLDKAIAEDPENKALMDEREKILTGDIGPKQEEAPVEAEPEKPKEDPVMLRNMAISLLEAGDIKGAVRAVDRAIDAEPEDADLKCLKANIVLVKGDIEGALFVVGQGQDLRPNHPGLYEVSARARYAKGDLKGANNDIDLAIANGADSSKVYEFKGKIMEGLGQDARAIACYSRAVTGDADNMNAYESLARLQLKEGRPEEARRSISHILRREPSRISAILIKAEIAVAMGDRAALLDAFDMISKCQIDDDTKIRMVRMLEENGCRIEAKKLMTGEQSSQSFDNNIKRNAEKVLRRAYTTRTSADDPDIPDALGFDDAMTKAVMEYLKDIPEAGPINVGSQDFAYMETMSRDVILKIKWTDLEKQPWLPLEKVFIAGNFKDADAAKALVSYVHKALFAPILSDPGEKMIRLSMNLPKGTTIYQIMEECQLGVYEAKMTKSLIV